MSKIDYYKFERQDFRSTLYLEVSKYKTINDAEKHVKETYKECEYVFTGITTREDMRKREPNDSKRVIPRG